MGFNLLVYYRPPGPFQQIHQRSPQVLNEARSLIARISALDDNPPHSKNLWVEPPDRTPALSVKVRTKKLFACMPCLPNYTHIITSGRGRCSATS